MNGDETSDAPPSTGQGRDADTRDFETGERDPDALRSRAGAWGNPGRDQHFLVDDRVLDRIPTYATGAGVDLSHVLEIGAGNGALTDRLLAVADRVTAVERDPDLTTFLQEEFADAIEDGHLTVIEGDALEVDLPEHTASISNLPYGASSEILFRLLPEGRPLIAMVQREFADRMAAAPGTDEYGRLSVTAGHYADVEVVEPVPPEAFAPPPAVESALVRALPREPDYTVSDDEFFLEFVTAVFTQRRKTVRNGIRNTTHISGLDDPDAVVKAADEELLGKRAGKLSPADFAALASLAHEVGFESDD
ncbi:16S ribosomal RNA methyltransferase A [Halorhabdus amylolytica]|uniref:16S ribosomal RNA methyltransferase A n=1 Tax=Halorhabdus amylolytica TaxID=2559573 RepID=UPI0010A9A269|nr:16S ribosomal RNA methyltransferase A [Halorhabdus amylolytica]